MAVKGKFVISKVDDVYYFELIANNGQQLYESRPYFSEKYCRAAVDNFVKHITSQQVLDVRRDKTGHYRWFYVNGPTYYMGIAYTTFTSAKENAESVRKFALISKIE